MAKSAAPQKRLSAIASSLFTKMILSFSPSASATALALSYSFPYQRPLYSKAVKLVCSVTAFNVSEATISDQVRGLGARSVSMTSTRSLILINRRHTSAKTPITTIVSMRLYHFVSDWERLLSFCSLTAYLRIKRCWINSFRTLMATEFEPPCGTIRSAYALVGSIWRLCMGLMMV